MEGCSHLHLLLLDARVKVINALRGDPQRHTGWQRTKRKKGNVYGSQCNGIGYFA